MGEMNDWQKIGGWCGVGFVVLFIVGIILQGDAPTSADTAADIRAWYADNHDTYIIGDFFFALAFVFFFLPFASCLSAYFGEREGNPPIWSRIILVAAVIFTAVGGALSGVQGTIAYHHGSLGDDTLVALVGINYYSGTVVFLFATALLVFCTGMLIMRKGGMWSWLAPVSMLYAVAALVAFFGLLHDDPEEGLGILQFIVFPVFGVWTLLVSVGLLKAPPPINTTT